MLYSKNHTVIEVHFVVGQLPHWYADETHDHYLEEWLEEVVCNQFGDDINITVEYVYSGDHELITYDSDGNEISRIDFDMSGAFSHVRENL